MAYLCNWSIVAIDQNSCGTCNLTPGCLWSMLIKMATACIGNNDWKGLKEAFAR